MWYGYYNFPIEFSINRFKKLNLLKKKTTIFKYFQFSETTYKTQFYLPNNWSAVLYQNTKNTNNYLYYFFTYNYFFSLTLPKTFIFLTFDSNIRTFLIEFFFKNNYWTLFWNYYRLIFFSFTKLFFKKIKFKGKGYYVFKNFRNTIAPQFGYSHIIRVYSFFLNVKFLTKTSIFLFGINKIEITKMALSFYLTKPINVFTGRGVRFSKQIVYRKTGKMSTYR